MNRVNKKVEYALMALKHMSEKKAGELSTVKEVCEGIGCPFDATARVMQAMVQNGFLKSEQGAHGGYLLIKDLSRVSMYELICTVLGPLEIVKCLGESSLYCDLSSRCNVKMPLYELNNRLVSFYKTISLKELLNPKEREAKTFSQAAEASLGGVG